MREISKGDYCRHRAMQSWGTGLVKNVSDQRVVVYFEHGGLRPIARSYVESMLKSVRPEDVPAEVRLVLEQGEPKPPARSLKAAVADKLCKACHKPLKHVVYAEKQNWKSCPKCSFQSGEFHVYFEYPRAFTSSAKKGAGKPSKIIQGYCTACQLGNQPTAATRLCGTLG